MTPLESFQINRETFVMLEELFSTLQEQIAGIHPEAITTAEVIRLFGAINGAAFYIREMLPDLILATDALIASSGLIDEAIEFLKLVKRGDVTITPTGRWT